jgi:hypothetical protein
MLLQLCDKRGCVLTAARTHPPSPHPFLSLSVQMFRAELLLVPTHAPTGLPWMHALMEGRQEAVQHFIDTGMDVNGVLVSGAAAAH